MSKIKINNLSGDNQISEEEMKNVKGGMTRSTGIASERKVGEFGMKVDNLLNIEDKFDANMSALDDVSMPLYGIKPTGI